MFFSKKAIFSICMVGSASAFTSKHNVLFASKVALKASIEGEIAVAEPIPDVESQSLSSTKEAELESDVNVQKTYIRSEALPFLVKNENLEGYVGDVGFDPFGFSDKYEMEYLREAELKHGRIAMLAWVGWIAVDVGGFRVTSEWQDIGVVEAHDQFSGWYGPLGQLFYGLGVYELFEMKKVGQMRVAEEGPAARVAGDLNWDVLKLLKDKSPEEVELMKLSEIKHARLGMLAFSGVVVQDAVIGASNFPYIELGNLPVTV